VQKVSRNAIPPRDCAELNIQYATPTGGSFQHVSAVRFYETAKPTAILIFGTVGAWREIHPTQLDFSEVCIGKEATRDVTVRLREPWPKSETITELLLEHGRLVQEEADPPGRKLTYRVAFAPPRAAECKEFRGQLIVRRKSSEDRVIKIPCIAKTVSPWSADPAVAFFGVVPRRSRRTIDLAIHMRESNTASELSRCTVKHSLSRSFQVETCVTPTRSLTVCVTLDTVRESTSGFLDGRIDVLGRDKGVMLSMPVSAFIQ